MNPSNIKKRLNEDLGGLEEDDEDSIDLAFLFVQKAQFDMLVFIAEQVRQINLNTKPPSRWKKNEQ